MAMLFFFSKGQSGISTDDTELMKDVGKNLDNYIVGLAFVVVAVMELTKIPLATACYYAAKWTWRTMKITAQKRNKTMKNQNRMERLKQDQRKSTK